jgi:hypothetical protein
MEPSISIGVNATISLRFPYRRARELGRGFRPGSRYGSAYDPVRRRRPRPSCEYRREHDCGHGHGRWPGISLDAAMDVDMSVAVDVDMSVAMNLAWTQAWTRSCRRRYERRPGS